MELRKRAMAIGCATALAVLAAAPPALAWVRVVEDPLEPAVVITTEHVNKTTRGVLRVTHNDHYLRAAIDRRTGAVRYELRQTVQYMGGFRDFQKAHYQSAEGVAIAPLARLETNQVHCDGLDPQAACFEVVSFEVPEAQLRALAAGGEATWSFKFKPRLGAEHRTEMPRDEIRALLAAVQSYQAGRPVAVASQGQP